MFTPLITASDCEGAGEMFQVTTLDMDNEFPKTDDGKVDYAQDFFGKQTSLTVSGQLNARRLMHRHSVTYVSTFGPTFRAENSNIDPSVIRQRFWMIEPEIAFADLEDDMDISRSYAEIRHYLRNGECTGRDEVL